MSDCCGNPSLFTDPGEITGRTGPYNPGEIRLYGRPGNIVRKPKDSVEAHAYYKEKIGELLGKNPKISPDNYGDFIEVMEVVIEDLLNKTVISADNVIVGVIASKYFHYLSVSTGVSEGFESVGVIYGYAYEGHCYKLPKPQIMILPVSPHKIVAAKCECERETEDERGSERKHDCNCGWECGYSAKLGYVVWSVDKLEQAVALDVRSDDLKTLILDENMPGNRSPLAYAQAMSLAPQRQRD
ncbi:hypothetical protein GGE07_002241 [Sinorhizobium terangae]|uniref:Uncharacterized protein n=1 Tax=Sinorhizobium terangae TaxID=110322 RepID=A0A6N7L8T5_SINTE|nr:hypothetical protein [Sinorhizobium terangae]MBB4185600.1 hypothetical protein [Sinorhizobium terangae]MQX13355.1 hypothetical protein [Sinorhizobium terangae]